jgi:adenine-specific DNA methylase
MYRLTQLRASRKPLLHKTLFAALRERLREIIATDTSREYANAISVYLALSVSRLANRCSTACFWDPEGENVQQVFTRQAIAMAWDFVEANPLSDAMGSFTGQVGYLSNVVQNLPAQSARGNSAQRSAERLSDIGLSVLISTDPPYYDNIDYADLSDFFYVWLRRMLSDVYPNSMVIAKLPTSTFGRAWQESLKPFVSKTLKTFPQQSSMLSSKKKRRKANVACLPLPSQRGG